MNVLLIASELPEDPHNGGDLRKWNLLDGQAEVLGLVRKRNLPDRCERLGRLSWRGIRLVEPGGYAAIRRWGNDPVAFAQANRELGMRLLAAIERYQNGCSDLKLIISDHALALLLIPFLQTPFVFDEIDSLALYFRRRASALALKQPLKALNSLAWFRTYQCVERTIARYAALYIVPGEADRRCILDACPEGRVMAIPNGTRWLEQPPIAPDARLSTPVIAFHGIMTWDPNRASASYLATRVFPLVRRAIPQAELRIAGGPVPPGLAALARQPGVEVAGFVPDIRHWLSSCSVYAMPMTQGSGVKNKLIEAMAAGIPIVTNSLGAEALPSHCREAVMIANGRRDLARSIIDLLNDPTRRAALRLAARSAAEQEFAWPRLAAQYRRAVLNAFAAFVAFNDEGTSSLRIPRPTLPQEGRLYRRVDQADLEEYKGELKSKIRSDVRLHCDPVKY